MCFRIAEFRIDAYNAYNQACITGRNPTVNYTSPTDQTVRNSQYLPDGSLNPNRLQPRNAGFGAANQLTTNLINQNYQRVIPSASCTSRSRSRICSSL